MRVFKSACRVGSGRVTENGCVFFFFRNSGDGLHNSKFTKTTLNCTLKMGEIYEYKLLLKEVLTNAYGVMNSGDMIYFVGRLAG